MTPAYPIAVVVGGGDGWHAPRLEAAYRDDDCGCPVEEWVHRCISLYMHFDDGGADVVADNGDWYADLTFDAATIDDARIAAFAWVDALPTEEDIARLAA